MQPSTHDTTKSFTAKAIRMRGIATPVVLVDSTIVLRIELLRPMVT